MPALASDGWSPKPALEGLHLVSPALQVPGTETATSRRWATHQLQKLKPHWPIILVLALFVATAFVVPTLTAVATTDDWGYTRSVEILYHDHELTVFPVVAATAVFQIGWGTLFAILFGMTLGVMRVATLVMVSLGALALYALLRELGVNRGRSALGTAAYLFNPLTFILSYTFMTDPYFTSLLIGSSYFYIRGLRLDKPDDRAILIGSFIAACAFLTRQQGALIPFAVVIELLITKRIWFNRASIWLFLKVVAIPICATIDYYLWLHFFNNVPAVQQGFFNEAKGAGIDGAWLLTRNLSVIELMYLGFFTLPVVAALIPGVRGAIRTMTRRAWVVFGVWAFVLWTGLVVFQVQGRGLALHSAVRRRGRPWPARCARIAASHLHRGFFRLGDRDLRHRRAVAGALLEPGNDRSAVSRASRRWFAAGDRTLAGGWHSAAVVSLPAAWLFARSLSAAAVADRDLPAALGEPGSAPVPTTRVGDRRGFSHLQRGGDARLPRVYGPRLANRNRGP